MAVVSDHLLAPPIAFQNSLLSVHWESVRLGSNYGVADGCMGWGWQGWQGVEDRGNGRHRE